MNIIDTKRNRCVITNSDNLENLTSIPNFPIYIGSTVDKSENDIFSDLIFDISKSCGIIQLRNTIEPSLIYSKYHSEAIGSVWENHHEELATTIKNVISKNNIKKVLEIGGSDAKLSNIILKDDRQITEWSIIEPNPKEIKDLDSRIRFVNNFFKSEIIDTSYDLVVHSHTIEHMYDPNTFLSEIEKTISENGFHVFSVPNLYKYLLKKFVNTLNFEHTIFLTEHMIDYLLSINNFEIVEKKYYLEHSIFYVCKKNTSVKKQQLPEKYNEYKNMFINYIEYYRNLVSDLNLRISKCDKDLYIFGAHVFSQFLITLGLRTDKIKFILDNSTIKNNTRLYGTNLIIKNPKEINFDDNSIIILKVGGYREEIIEGLLKLNSNLKFWE